MRSRLSGSWSCPPSITDNRERRRISRLAREEDDGLAGNLSHFTFSRPLIHRGGMNCTDSRPDRPHMNRLGNSAFLSAFVIGVNANPFFSSNFDQYQLEFAAPRQVIT